MRTILTRTKLATAAAVVAIAVTGAVAVGANVGILDSASDSATGELSAAGDLVSPTSTVLDVYLDDAGRPVHPTVAPSSTVAPRGTQEFTVDAAGSISIVGDPDAVRLDAVHPAPGWRWTMTQTDPATLSATFTDGSRTLQFDASADRAGAIAASVTEPIVVPVPAAGGAVVTPSVGSSSGGPVLSTPSAAYGDDDHDDNEDDEDHYEGSEDDD